MLVVIDGPRGAGKTTFVEALKLALIDQGIDAEALKYERQPGLDLHMAMVDIINATAGDDKVYIVDRFHLTEWVMSLALGRRDPIELDASTWIIDELLENNGGLVFILLPDPDMLRLRHRIREEKKEVDLEPGRAWTYWVQAAVQSRTAIIYPNETWAMAEEAIIYTINLILAKGVVKK